MKKILTILLSSILIGCGSGGNGTNNVSRETLKKETHGCMK